MSQLTTKSGDIFNIEEFTYESIDDAMVNTSYYLLSNLRDFSIPFHFEVSTKIHNVLSSQIDKFGTDKGVMLNGFKFIEDKTLQESEIKIVVI